METPSEGDAVKQANQEWVPKRKLIHGMPKGLEYLTKLELPIVKKYLGEIPDECVLPYEVSRKFRIFDKMGGIVYYAFEEKGTFFDTFCANRRTFTYHITDRDGATVFSIDRNYHCFMGLMCCACAPMCQDSINVYSPEGETFGVVRHQWGCLKPTWKIEDGDKQVKYELNGPPVCLTFQCCDPTLQFSLKNVAPKMPPPSKNDGGRTAQLTHTSAPAAPPPEKVKPGKIGYITRSISSSKKNRGGDTDDPNYVPAFGMQVPKDMDVKMKAVIISAAFLINAHYYDTLNPPVPPPGTPPPRASVAKSVTESVQEEKEMVVVSPGEGEDHAGDVKSEVSLAASAAPSAAPTASAVTVVTESYSPFGKKKKSTVTSQLT